MKTGVVNADLGDPQCGILINTGMSKWWCNRADCIRPWCREGAKKRKRNWRALALILGIAIIALSFGGCNSRILRSDTNPEVTRVHLGGAAGEVFRKITGAKAMTLSENLAVYGHENPPSALLACHEESENGHAGQAEVIGDALVAIGAIDDDPIGRGCAWQAIYACEWLQRGYEGNRYELGARKACRHLEK